MAIENRFIRIEDWNGNVYIPDVASSGAGTGGIESAEDASNNPLSDIYTEGTKISDDTASKGTAIYLTSDPTESKVLFAEYISRLPYGDIATNVRLKSSIASGSTKLIQFNAYVVDKSTSPESSKRIYTSYITGDTIGIENTYVILSEMFKYESSGIANPILKIELVVLPGTGGTFYFDYLTAFLDTTGLKNKIYVDGKQLVIF